MISRNESPACTVDCTPSCTCTVPSSIARTVLFISAWIVRIICAISLVAVVVRSASLWTSSATTAKPRPCSLSPGGLNGRIESEKVGLVCNIVNDSDYAADLVGAFAQFLHLLCAGSDCASDEPHLCQCFI